MASSYCWKLHALIKKNLIIMKRNIFSTLFEIFFPIVLFVVIIALREAFPIETYTFKEEEKNIENFINDKSMTTIKNIVNDEGFDPDSYSWNGMSVAPPFKICSKLNNQDLERPLIGDIGIPQEIKNQMMLDSLEFKDEINFEITEKSFKKFETVEQMNNYIKDQHYGADPNTLICFGVKFSYETEEKLYNYSLHFFDFEKMGREGIQDIACNDQGMFDTFKSGPDLESFLKYKNGAYTYMMKTINQYILRKETGDQNAELNYAIGAMKYIDYRIDSFGEFLGYMITIIIVIAYMSPLSLYIYRMVGEKETKTKEGMKIMGLREGEYFLSYFLQYLIISIVVSFINALLFQVVLNHIPLHFLYALIFLWSLDVFALIFFFQSFIDKTRIAIVLSLVIYFIMYCISLACMFEKTSMKLKLALSLFPAVSLNIGILLLSKFEYHFRNFYNRDFLIDHYNYSIGLMYLMFIIDFFVYLFLGYYLHNVLPHEFGIRKPWYFLCSSDYWCNTKDKKRKYLNIKNKLELPEFNTDESRELEEDFNVSRRTSKFESEDIYENKTKSEVLEIRNIVKIFEDGKKAVDGVNLNFYRDEIFALLGHNGAGKTTLISILTGMYEATKGKAIYDGINILDSNNMDLFREKLGICPQHDILFEDLNIREHLEMFSIFKGVDSNNVEAEVNKILHDFQLENIQNMIARNLSAGQRRKLSISIALIGGSEVIFLDEPSSGMDITSRRNLWEILKRQSEGKIIILTTHYMEEASVLGQRIGIINAGHMKCLGSPLFLIEKYGKYMSLNILKDEYADDKKIVEFVKTLAKNVEYEILSEEIMFRIPVRDNNNIDKKARKKVDIPKFFQVFDKNLNDLKIKSYSASMPTLEDVFLNVAAEDSRKINMEKEKEMEMEEENDKILFSSNLKEDYSQKSKFKNDFYICMKRRYLITKRDVKGFLMEILCPIILVLFGLLISKVEMTYHSAPYVIDIKITGKQNILFASLTNNNIEDYFINDIDVVTSKKLENFGRDTNNKKEAIKNFVEKIFEISNSTEDSKNHEVDMTSDSYKGYFASLLMLKDDNNKYQFVMILNTRVKHSVAIFPPYLLQSIIEKSCGNKIKVKYTHSPLPLTYNLKEQTAIGNNLAIVFFISIAFALMPANFISLLVKERINNSKHLMRISGINILSYWICNYIFELIKYYFTAGICVLLLWSFDYYRDYLYILYITYGPGMISITYALSFLFDNESNAQNSVILLNFIFGDLGSIIVLVLRGVPSMKNFAKIIEYILAIVPTFTFDFSFNLLLNKMNVYTIDYPDEWIYFTGDEMIKKFNLLLSMVIFSSAECLIYTILFIIIERRTYVFKTPTDEKLISDVKDEEVLQEIERANNRISEKIIFSERETNEIYTNSIYENNQNKEETFSVRIKNLRKIYRNGCLSKAKDNTIAIKNLNFCIKPGECFGLLGLNGAGKTTTFKCITQEIAQDNGSIFINGQNIAGRFNELNELFGYCPQFDAIFEHLTVYENLEFFARIKGIKYTLINKLVNSMIKEMSLEEFTDKISGRLSGGNKRKLAVAISLIGNHPIILLDEPSTGMDPEARRFMWSVIHKISTKGSSVIMTTHSMDEAETLCKRMGIMVNGEFVCLGKANEIKEKYGFGYEIDVRIKPINQITLEEILAKYSFEKELLVNKNNVESILNTMGKNYFMEELKEGRLGKRIIKSIELNKGVYIGVIINWIHFAENAIKFIHKGKDYFEQIILAEHIENNFLFKMKKGNDVKSIGFFFGLFEESKEECHVTEYSIQQTSLEQIFNKFATNQGKESKKISEENILEENKMIIVDEILFNNILS